MQSDVNVISIDEKEMRVPGISEAVEQKQKELKKDQEQEMLKHLFESTVAFFRMVNKTMVALNYSRQRRRQIFDDIIKKSSISDTDVIKGMLEELKPVFEDAKQLVNK